MEQNRKPKQLLDEGQYVAFKLGIWALLEVVNENLLERLHDIESAIQTNDISRLKDHAQRYCFLTAMFYYELQFLSISAGIKYSLDNFDDLGRCRFAPKKEIIDGKEYYELFTKVPYEPNKKN